MKKNIITLLTLIHFLCINVFAQEKPTWGPYMKTIEKNIYSTWEQLVKGYTDKKSGKIYLDNQNKIKAVANFKIHRNGDFSDIKIFKTSGDKYFDDIAIDSLKKTSGCCPLPEEFKGESIPIEFSFDYNIVYKGALPKTNQSNSSKNLKEYMDFIKTNKKENWGHALN